jgi:hypothetical protein
LRNHIVSNVLHWGQKADASDGPLPAIESQTMVICLSLLI